LSHRPPPRLRHRLPRPRRHRHRHRRRHRRCHHPRRQRGQGRRRGHTGMPFPPLMTLIATRPPTYSLGSTRLRPRMAALTARLCIATPTRATAGPRSRVTSSRCATSPHRTTTGTTAAARLSCRGPCCRTWTLSTSSGRRPSAAPVAHRAGDSLRQRGRSPCASTWPVVGASGCPRGAAPSTQALAWHSSSVAGRDLARRALD